MRKPLATQLKEVTGRLDALEGQHPEALAEEVRRLRVALDEVASETDDVGYAVDGLADRIRLLERRFRTGGTIAVADFDHWPAGCAERAEEVRTGQDARAGLLDERRRDEWLAVIGRPDELRATMSEQRAAALAAARSVTELDPADADAWKGAVEAWNAAVSARKRAGAELPEALAAAGQARTELDAATERNDGALPKVQHGERARADLVATIRARLDAAVRDDLLFPAWFETALGPGAPSTNTESWLETAVDVVTYRLVAGVDDQILALGRRPAGEGWQRQEYDRLANACRGGRV
ncbi:hypothetical protein [Pseudonocardia acaciae]|uniref:hypothetical protein n=1 Tax=Pseudonocardia acaciae TaxID=551276 RepID=UPI000684A5B8|nr:hypothetical protein [Pseudonocardia acaciae]